MDEAFYVLEGSGNVVLDDVTHAFDRGASIFIPKNTWQGFENPRHELRLLWIVSPAGLDGFFRDTCSRPGGPVKSLSRDQIRESLAGMTRSSGDVPDRVVAVRHRQQSHHARIAGYLCLVR
jgi:hypothetical protein